MEQSPSDAPLLYRARYLAACLVEDRKEIDKQWTKVQSALNLAISQAEQRADRRRLAYLMLGLGLVAVGIAALLFPLVNFRTDISGSSLTVLVFPIANLVIVLVVGLFKFITFYREMSHTWGSRHHRDGLGDMEQSD